MKTQWKEFTAEWTKLNSELVNWKMELRNSPRKDVCIGEKKKSKDKRYEEQKCLQKRKGRNYLKK